MRKGILGSYSSFVSFSLSVSCTIVDVSLCRAGVLFIKTRLYSVGIGTNGLCVILFKNLHAFIQINRTRSVQKEMKT